MIDQLNSTTLMSLPLFVMAAAFMRRGGVAQALVDLSTAWLGGVQGSLGLVAVVSCALFAAISGSSVATALAMGTILLPAMMARGYPRGFALGVIGASGTIGIVIPPSLALILYGIVAEQSVPRLFLAGILPGLLQAAAFFVWVLWYARYKNFPSEPALPFATRLRVTLRALPAMAVPFVVLVGIYGGYTTVTEAAALAAVTSLLVSLIVYRGFRLDPHAGGDRRGAVQRRRDHADHRHRAGVRPLDDRLGRARPAGGVRRQAGPPHLGVPAGDQHPAAGDRLLPGGGQRRCCW